MKLLILLAMLFSVIGCGTLEKQHRTGIDIAPRGR